VINGSDQDPHADEEDVFLDAHQTIGEIEATYNDLGDDDAAALDLNPDEMFGEGQNDDEDETSDMMIWQG